MAADACVTVSDVCLSYGKRTLLNNVSFSIHIGDKIGIIGRNGCGKTSFLKLLTKIEEPNSGNIYYNKKMVVGYVSQNNDLSDNITIREEVSKAFIDINQKIKEYYSLPATSKKRDKLEVELNIKDAWNLDYKIDKMMNDLKITNPDSIIKTLSGGEKRRVILCRELLKNPDFLILDEPTNHLDFDAIKWLENFFLEFKKTLIFVTHDRYFLDKISSKIIELYNGKFYSYKGNYTDYLIQKALREDILDKNEDKRKKYLNKELDWIQRSPKARTTKSQSRINKYFESKNKEEFKKESEIEPIIPNFIRLGKKVLELKNISLNFGRKQIFTNLDFKLEAKQKIGIIGPNGVGKTTLLKIILGQLNPSEGQVIVGENTVFNYIDQEKQNVDSSKTLFEEIGNKNETVLIDGKYISLRGYLKRYLFTDEEINMPLKEFSGGELSRALLAKKLKQGGNFLIFDEPTNDLDLFTLRVLESALIDFKGCMFIVSHDRYFLNRICTHILAFEQNSELFFNVGNFDDYIEKRNDHFFLKEALLSTKAKKKQNIPKKKINKLTWKEEKELEAIEEKIIAAEAKQSELECLFSSNDFYEKYGSKQEELANQFELSKKKVIELYARWDELESKKKALEI